MKPKKIAIICFNLGWQTGGPRLLFAQAKASERLGHRVIIYTPEFDGTYFKDLWKGLDIRVIAGKHAIAWQYSSSNLFSRILQKLANNRAQNGIARAIAKGMDPDFDIVNCHDYGYKVIPFYKQRNPRAKCIWTMHDRIIQYLPKPNIMYDLLSRIYNACKEWNERRLYARADAVVVLTERNRSWVESQGLKAKVVRTGIDFEKFYAPVKVFSAPKKKCLLLGVGALNKYRRFEDIIEAAAILRNKGYDATARLICKDLWNMKEDKADLLAHTKRLGMERFVDFRFDGASEAELIDSYRTCDYCIVPLYTPPPRNGNPWSMIIFEGMAAGAVGITCTTNDVAEEVKDGRELFLVEPLRPDLIAAKIAMSLDDPLLYRAVAERGQSFIKSHMSWDRYAREVYASVGE